jgi:hypothetical protein
MLQSQKMMGFAWTNDRKKGLADSSEQISICYAGFWMFELLYVEFNTACKSKQFNEVKYLNFCHK